MAYWHNDHCGISDFKLYNQRLRSHETHCHGNYGGSIWNMCGGGMLGGGYCTGGGFWGALKSGFGWSLGTMAVGMLFNGIGRLFGGAGMYAGGGYGLGGGLFSGGLLGGMPGLNMYGINDWFKPKTKDEDPEDTKLTDSDKDNYKTAGINDEADMKKLQEAGINAVEAKEWRDKGFNDVDNIIEYAKNDITPEEAENWKDTETNAEKIKAYIDAKLDKDLVKVYIDKEFTDIEDMKKLKDAGITTANEINKYKTDDCKTAKQIITAKNDANEAAAATEAEETKKWNNAGITDQDQINALKGKRLKPEDISALKTLKPDIDLTKYITALSDANKAKEILVTLGLHEEGTKEAKLSTNYAVLLLLKASGLNVNVAQNPKAEDKMIQGKISNVIRGDDGKISYTVDNREADGDFNLVYNLEETGDNPNTFKVISVTNPNPDPNKPCYLNPNWAKREYKWNAEKGTLVLVDTDNNQGVLISKEEKEHWTQVNGSEEKKDE